MSCHAISNLKMITVEQELQRTKERSLVTQTQLEAQVHSMAQEIDTPRTRVQAHPSPGTISFLFASIEVILCLEIKFMTFCRNRVLSSAFAVAFPLAHLGTSSLNAGKHKKRHVRVISVARCSPRYGFIGQLQCADLLGIFKHGMHTLQKVRRYRHT
jgi:hypothetical protein